ncbi:MAG TPA: protein kinase [Syntrophorhabdaceae bacterium]|jgi:tetratricopeptide (TPR) repeat protein/tRNA A-37 threonylcarbamoyl transferase component Bud32
MTVTSIKDDQGFKGLFPIGTLIHSRYEILSEGKMGGMGMVYKCRDTRHERHREVALKLMQPKLLDSCQGVERFRHEAAVSRDLLHHPNIVRVYHDDEWQDGTGNVWYYILMEWIEGRSLRDLLVERKKTGKPFTLWETYRIISQLTAALSYGHRQEEKILHRDVKPENILLTDEATSSIKLADFGIAKIIGPGTSSGISTAIGVSPYMSPELREGRSDVDQRTDVYSTGVVLYELLTLDNTAGPFCPSEVNGAVPKEMDAIYKKAVAPKPEQRYQDVLALSDDILTEARKEGVRLQAGGRTGRFPGSIAAGGAVKKSSRVAIMALAALIVLAGVVAAFLGFHNRQEGGATPGNIAAIDAQEQAEKERQAREETVREEEAMKEAEARKEKEAKKEKEDGERARQARTPETKPAAPKAQAKEDLPAKMKRWQKQLKLATIPDASPASKPDRTGATVIAEEPGTQPEPEKKPVQASRERGAMEPHKPRAVEEGRVAVPSGSTADLYYRKGLQFVKGKHFLQASGDFSRAIEIDPGHELSFYWRGVSNYKLNNYTKALSDFTSAIRIEQNDLYYHWRGVTYFKLNNYYMAVNDFTQALRIRPNNIDYRWRGACYSRLGKQMEADADFAAASQMAYERGPVRGSP